MNKQFFTLVFALLVTMCHAEAAVLLTSENQLLNPGTYEVASNVKLTRNLTFKEGTTLIFNGGKLVADKEVTITGKSTAVEAPDAVIFSSNIKADGMWRIPYASPLWWEPVITSATLDYAPGINKAAIMIYKGVVRLPRGPYFIGESLMLPVGVTLRGASGCASRKNMTNDNTPLFEGSTLLLPINGSGKWIENENDTIKCGFMVYANSTVRGEIKHPYPVQWNVLEDISLKNSVSLPFLRGVYVAGGGGFDGVTWASFGQAVCYSHDYADNKKIVDCQVYGAGLNKSEGTELDRKQYVFDIGFLGDALLIEHCHIGNDYFKALFISGCGGGVVNGNIISGDVYITGSKSMVFSANHMEGGAQLKVRSSVVDINNNLIEKGSRPSVDISSGEGNVSVVTLRNNQYLVYQQGRTEAERDKDIKANRFSNMSETDVQVDSRGLVRIDNEYRYEMVVGFGAMRPVGISIGSDNGNFYGFNQKSYAYSLGSNLLPDYGLQASARIKGINESYVAAIMGTEWVDWFRPTGYYLYSYQFVLDPEREIYERYKGKVTLVANSGSPIKLEHHKDGALIVLGRNDGGTMCSMLRLFRTCVKSESDHTPLKKVETVDVPIVGGIMLYDNGISICGYKWREIGSIPEPTSRVVYKALRIDGTNVSAWSESLPDTSKGWRVGDIIYNVGSSTSWQTEIVK